MVLVYEVRNVLSLISSFDFLFYRLCRMMQVASKGSAADADSYGNSNDVEASWAMQAMDHAECHMSLLLTGTIYPGIVWNGLNLSN